MGEVGGFVGGVVEERVGLVEGGIEWVGLLKEGVVVEDGRVGEGGEVWI